MGDIPITDAGEGELGALFKLPGDDKYFWVATGIYADGTFDLVREGATLQREQLIGWRPGQSREDYEAEMDKEASPPRPPEEETGKAHRRYPQPAPAREQEPVKKEPKARRRRRAT